MYNIKKWNTFGAIFTMIVGTLLHFAYEWIGKGAAIIGAVNESTWEHLKLLFWPAVIFGIVEYFVYGKKITCFIDVMVKSILIGLSLIIILFYTYSGVLGYNVMYIDIAIFFIAVIASYIYSYRKMCLYEHSCPHCASVTWFIILLILILMFVLFTFAPPQIALFQDPVTGSYGIQ